MKHFRSVRVGLLAAIGTLLVALAVTAPARDYPTRQMYDAESVGNLPSFRNFAYDTAGTAAYKLVTTGTFTQLTGADTLRLQSSTATDSAAYRVYYVKTDTSLSSTTGSLIGTDTSFTSAYAQYLEIVVTDTASGGTVTIYGKTKGALAIINPGQTRSYGTFHFFGKGGGGLWGWSAGIDTTTSPLTNAGVRFQLRLYNRHLDAVNTPESGYEVIDQVVLPDDISGQREMDISLTKGNRALFVPSNGYVGVYAVSTSGTVSTTRITASISGYDRAIPRK